MIVFRYSVFKVRFFSGTEQCLLPSLFVSFLDLTCYERILLVPVPRRWRQRDSNSRPPACKAGALPTELCPRFWQPQSCIPPVGLSGLEPPTSRLSGVRSNRLSYKPKVKSLQPSLCSFFFLQVFFTCYKCLLLATSVFYLFLSGSHLLSHAVSSIVPSAA